MTETIPSKKTDRLAASVSGAADRARRMNKQWWRFVEIEYDTEENRGKHPWRILRVK